MFKKILSNKISATALFCVLFFFLLAVFSYQIMPDKTPLANSIQLSIAKQKPGFNQIESIEQIHLIQWKYIDSKSGNF